MGIYDDRRMTEASVYGIQFIEANDRHEAGIGATVHLGVSSIDGGDQGPGLTVDIFVPASKGASLAALHDEAIDRALDLVARIAAESREEVKNLLKLPPSLDLEKR